MDRRIEVVPYNPDWARLFREEAEKIRSVLGEEVIHIHHMGSTAIPGIKAKPTIDILVEVCDIGRLDGFEEMMAAAGYQSRGEFGIPGRRFYIKDNGHARTHHIHAFQTGHPEIERTLSFRDYLIAHPQEAEAYSRLKEALADKYRQNRERYTESKTDFIRDIDRKALQWKRQLRQAASD